LFSAFSKADGLVVIVLSIVSTRNSHFKKIFPSVT
jgi:hypothetical protein